MIRKVLILDSSQISTYYECPTKHQLEYNENLTLSNEPSDAIAAGTMGHKLLEVYYSTGSPKSAIEIDVDKLDEVDQEGFPLKAETRALVVKRFRDYVMNYSHNDFKPLTQTQHRIDIDESGMPKDVTYEKPLVEQGFSYELLKTNEYLFILEGRIDILADFSGTTCWVDHKWQFRQRDLYSKSIQFRNYSLATGLSIGIINYIRLQATQGPTTFKRQPVSFSALELRQWREELIDKYVEICREGPRQRNRDACQGKFGYECQYTRLCEEYNAETRYAIQARDFVTRREWTPWRFSERNGTGK